MRCSTRHRRPPLLLQLAVLIDAYLVLAASFYSNSTTQPPPTITSTSGGGSGSTTDAFLITETYTWTVGEGTTEALYFVQDKDSSGAYFLPTTLDLVGPTTVVATLDFDNEPWVNTVATIEPTTFTFTTTLLSGVEVIVIPDGTVQSLVQITGPTTWIATLSAEYPINTAVHTEELPSVGVFTYTLNEGTEVIDVPVWPQQTLSPVTLIGPETLVLTITHEYDEFVEAGSISGDPHCSASTVASNPNRMVTYATFATILTAGETLITAVPTLPNPGDGFVATTFTGPTTISITLVADLLDIDAELPYGTSPGQVCAGECGFCQIYFPTVFVYYWPVPSPNNACLGESENAAANISLTARDRIIVPRSLPGLAGFSGSGSTLVNSDGFTFTSPSAYIAFPTISAYDGCGILGNVHTSVTLGVAPGDLSSIIFQNYGTITQSFDFADAQCPPSSLNGSNTYSIIGQTGYNPIIAAPSAVLTNLDPAWGGLCFIAGFQGNDPPFALSPQSALLPSLTSVDPIIIATPASPSSAFPTLAQQTLRPTTMFTPQTATLPSYNPPQSSGVSADPVLAPSVLPQQQSTNNLPTNDPPQSYSISGDPAVASSALPPQQGTNNIPAESTPAIYTSPIVVNGVSTALTPLTTAMAATSPVSAYVIGSQTLVAGGPAITISSTPISLGPSASYIVVGSSTQTLAVAPASAPPQPTPVQQLTAFGSTFTANSASAFIIGSQTLTPGGSITVSGTLISLAPSASYLVIGSSTQTLAAAPLSAQPNAPPVHQLTAFGSTFTANSASAFIIGSQTLTPGGSITVSGTVFALPTGPSASYVLENGSTVPLALVTALPSASDPVIMGQTLTPLGVPATTTTTTTTTTQGLASLIMNPFGGGSSNASAGGVGTFKGAAVGGRDARSLGCMMGWVVVAVVGSWAVGGRM
ncbi:hypothetical protein MMC17_000832 [Xylographa soralifera]|nr:hypothetical protein [Xylographa soralifera]